jgi:hypothetical protein
MMLEEGLLGALGGGGWEDRWSKHLGRLPVDRTICLEMDTVGLEDSMVGEDLVGKEPEG